MIKKTSNKQILRSINESIKVLRVNRRPKDNGSIYLTIQAVFARSQLPYLIQKEGTVLNRDYTPLGVIGSSDVDYDDYHTYIDPSIAKEILNDEIINLDGGYFYTNPPWQSEIEFAKYMIRLNRMVDIIEKHVKKV